MTRRKEAGGGRTTAVFSRYDVIRTYLHCILSRHGYDEIRIDAQMIHSELLPAVAKPIA
jgi:hypothetical protein